MTTALMIQSPPNPSLVEPSHHSVYGSGSHLHPMHKMTNSMVSDGAGGVNLAVVTSDSVVVDSSTTNSNRIHLVSHWEDHHHKHTHNHHSITMTPSGASNSPLHLPPLAVLPHHHHPSASSPTSSSSPQMSSSPSPSSFSASPNHLPHLVRTSPNVPSPLGTSPVSPRPQYQSSPLHLHHRHHHQTKLLSVSSSDSTSISSAYSEESTILTDEDECIVPMDLSMPSRKRSYSPSDSSSGEENSSSSITSISSTITPSIATTTIITSATTSGDHNHHRHNHNHHQNQLIEESPANQDQRRIVRTSSASSSSSSSGNSSNSGTGIALPGKPSYKKSLIKRYCKSHYYNHHLYIVSHSIKPYQITIYLCH